MYEAHCSMKKIHYFISGPLLYAQAHYSMHEAPLIYARYPLFYA